MMKRRISFEELGRKADTARGNLESKTKRVTWKACYAGQQFLENIKDRCIAKTTEIETYTGEVEES